MLSTFWNTMPGTGGLCHSDLLNVSSVPLSCSGTASLETASNNRHLTSEFHIFQTTCSYGISLQHGGFLKFLPGHTHHMLEIFAGKSPSNVTCQHWFLLARVRNYFWPAVMAIFISINLLTECKHLLRVTSLVCPVASKVCEKWMPAWPLLSSLADSNCSLRDRSFDPVCPCQICLVMAWRH